MKYANNVTGLIGNTPLVKLQKASTNGTTVLGKCEFMNPTHSVKDRIGLNMIQTALDNGDIQKDTTIIEPTSGNTGIALASVCAAFGLKLILTMPSSMSIERRKLLKKEIDILRKDISNKDKLITEFFEIVNNLRLDRDKILLKQKEYDD